MASLEQKPDPFMAGDPISASEMNQVREIGIRAIRGAAPAYVSYFGDRVSIGINDIKPQLPGASNYLRQFIVREEFPDYLLCTPYFQNNDGQYLRPQPYFSSLGYAGTPIWIAKPYLLQQSTWDQREVLFYGNRYFYNYVGLGQRYVIPIVNGHLQPAQAVLQQITPAYIPGDLIVARRGLTGFTNPNASPTYPYGSPIVWQDIDEGARSWQFVSGSTVTSTVYNGGITNVPGTPPPGTFNPPVLLHPGPPTWIPLGGTYPAIWNPIDLVWWNWDGRSWVIGGSGLDWTAHQDDGTDFGGTLGGTPGKRWHPGGVHTWCRTGTQVLIPDVLYAVPYCKSTGTKITSMAMGLQACADGKHLHLGIFKCKDSGRFPGPLYFDSGEIELPDSADLPALIVAEVNKYISPSELVWLVAITDYGGSYQFLDGPEQFGLNADVIGFGDDGTQFTAAGPGVALSVSFPYDDLPDTFPDHPVIIGESSNQAPAIMVQL